MRRCSCGVPSVARLDASAVLSQRQYADVRASYYGWVAAARARRRVRLAPDGVVQFEAPEFVLWHVHELLRAEGWSAARIDRTLGDVEPWCAGPDELVATVMLDSAEAVRGAQIAEALARPGGLRLWAGEHVLGSEVAEAGTGCDPVWYLRWRVPRWWPAVLHAAPICVIEPTWDAPAVRLHPTTTAALRADLVEARRRTKPVLHRLASRTQRHDQSQRTRHSARP